MGRAVSAVKQFAKRILKLVLQPDPQVLWVPNAIRAGRQILQELSHDVILVTAPAYSSFFIGTALKRQFGLPLVLDYRDEWDLSGKYLENASRDSVSKLVQERMQRYVLKRADAVVATTRASTSNLADKLACLKKTKTRAVTVYNGFDAEDFDHDQSSRHSLQDSHSIDSQQIPTQTASLAQPMIAKPFRILYTGTLWNLTTIKPLVDAVLKLNQTFPELVSQLELVCVGRKTSEQALILEQLKQTSCRLEQFDYCEHSKVLEWLDSADAVCLLLSDVVGAERVVPAKLFEYLACRKEMLAIVPRGETAEIVQRYFPAGQFEPKDVPGIADWLRHRLADENGNEHKKRMTDDISEFSRENQARQLVELLNDLVRERRAMLG
jgi:glycosyltransferase involved in cell wall biosynthesis